MCVCVCSQTQPQHSCCLAAMLLGHQIQSVDAVLMVFALATLLLLSPTLIHTHIRSQADRQLMLLTLRVVKKLN